MSVTNSVRLIGHVGKDPEVKRSQAGNLIVKFSLATRRPTAEKQTDWHQCTCFQKTAELVEKYVRKGSLVAVQGAVQYTKLEDGRTFSEIIVDGIEFLGGKREDGAEPSKAEKPTAGEEMPF